MVQEQTFTSFEELIDNFVYLIKKSRDYVPKKKQLQYEREVMANISQSAQALTESLKPIYNRHSKSLEQSWKQLCEMAATHEREVRIRELERPASSENFQTNLAWISEHGTDKEVDLLEKLQESPPYVSDEISKLLDVAIQRIRALVEATQIKLSAAEERRLKRLIAKSEEGTLTPKELDAYRILAQQAEQLSVKRAEALAELKQRRGTPIHVIMEKVS